MKTKYAKPTKSQTLKVIANVFKKDILHIGPTTEHDLIKECSNRFTGYTIGRDGNNYATVYGEVYSHKKNEIACINFTVKSCFVFYKRDDYGRIINIEYFNK